MDALKRISSNKQAHEAAMWGGGFAVAALASLALRSSSYRLRPESRLFLRDFAVITGICSLVAFAAAYHLANLTPEEKKPTPEEEAFEAEFDPTKPRKDLLNDRTTGLKKITKIPDKHYVVWNKYGLDLRDQFAYMVEQDKKGGKLIHPYLGDLSELHQKLWRAKLMAWRATCTDAEATSPAKTEAPSPAKKERKEGRK